MNKLEARIKKLISQNYKDIEKIELSKHQDENKLNWLYGEGFALIRILNIIREEKHV
jgi:hypothetical protein